jgi:hypothetical protein
MLLNSHYLFIYLFVYLYNLEPGGPDLSEYSDWAKDWTVYKSLFDSQQ